MASDVINALADLVADVKAKAGAEFDQVDWYFEMRPEIWSALSSLGGFSREKGLIMLDGVEYHVLLNSRMPERENAHDPERPFTSDVLFSGFRK